MAIKRSAADFIPAARPLSLPLLRAAAAGCQGCDLYRDATQTVFGEGPVPAQMMFVGEQPGDVEDREGRPFVGPAGELLDQLLESAGIDRGRCYVTNAVKHFRFAMENGRRVGKKPNLTEIRACRPWLEEEIELVRPRVLVCLGSVAAMSLIDKDFKVTQQRGIVYETRWAAWTMATLHPSALLRMPDPELRERARRAVLDDLSNAAAQVRRAA